MSHTNVKHPLVISEKTLIPISLLMSMFAGIFLAAQVYNQTHSNKTKIDELAKTRLQMDVRIFDRLESVSSELSDLKAQNAKISGQLDILVEKSLGRKIP